MGRTAVVLDDYELTLLDGRCSEKVQAQVDAARARIAAQATYDLAPHLAGFAADVVTEARTAGRLVRYQRRLRRCSVCGRSAGYAVYKSGPRRGEKNLGRPLTFAGVEFARRSVSVEGSAAVGACDECVEAVLPTLIKALHDVPAEVPMALAAEGRPAWVWNQNRCCSACGWSGHEGEMGLAKTLLGDGTYPASCPACGAENLPFRPAVVKYADGFTLVEGEQG